MRIAPRYVCMYVLYTHIMLELWQVGILITGQNEREETTQDTTVTRSAACASYTPII